MGWERQDSRRALAAMTEFYLSKRRVMMNMFQPSVKLVSKKRVGSRRRRQYDALQTRLDQLIQSPLGDVAEVSALHELRACANPFELAATIEYKLERIWDLANSKPRVRTKKKHGLHFQMTRRYRSE